jgi:hypothetical protein
MSVTLRFTTPLLLGAAALLCLAPTAGAAPPAPAEHRASTPAAKPGQQADPNAFQMILEPRAMGLLKATSEKLAAAKTLTFTAVVGYEYPSKLGPPIVYTSRYDVTMQRPDKLRVVMPGDGPASEFYYDGKTMVAYAPTEDLAAIVAAPPTVDEALKAAFQKAAIYFPFTDLLVSDPYAALADGARLAFYVGPSVVVGDVKTDMVVWANDEVFLQMWIGTEDKLPRRIRAIYRTDPLALRHEVTFGNWQLDPVVGAETFAATKAQRAGRMEFNAPALPPKGVKPIVPGMTDKPAAAAPKSN